MSSSLSHEFMKKRKINCVASVEIEILKLLKLYSTELCSKLLFLKQLFSLTKKIYPRKLDLKVENCAYRLKLRLNLVSNFSGHYWQIELSYSYQVYFSDKSRICTDLFPEFKNCHAKVNYDNMKVMIKLINKKWFPQLSTGTTSFWLPLNTRQSLLFWVFT